MRATLKRNLRNGQFYLVTSDHSYLFVNQADPTLVEHLLDTYRHEGYGDEDVNWALSVLMGREFDLPSGYTPNEQLVELTGKTYRCPGGTFGGLTMTVVGPDRWLMDTWSVKSSNGYSMHVNGQDIVMTIEEEDRWQRMNAAAISHKELAGSVTG